jgi:hypothetical protein
LSIGSSFLGWQSLNFTLPAQAALATSTADPDQDGIVNLFEYALRLTPQANNPPGALVPMLNASSKLRLSFAVRDDDPKLSLTLEAASDLTFASITTISPVITDPVPGDGLKTLEFTDTITAPRRFGRIKIVILP